MNTQTLNTQQETKKHASVKTIYHNFFVSKKFFFSNHWVVNKTFVYKLYLFKQNIANIIEKIICCISLCLCTCVTITNFWRIFQVKLNFEY